MGTSNGKVSMKLTKKVQVAVEALAHVGLKQAASPVNLTVISRELNVSVSYLEGIFQSLRLAGWVSPVRGPGGGYRLAHMAQDISIATIAQTVEPARDNSAEAEPLAVEGSPVEDRTRALVLRAHETELAFLEQVSLQDLLVQASHREKRRHTARQTAVNYGDRLEEALTAT